MNRTIYVEAKPGQGATMPGATPRPTRRGAVRIWARGERVTFRALYAERPLLGEALLAVADDEGCNRSVAARAWSIGENLGRLFGGDLGEVVPAPDSLAMKLAQGYVPRRAVVTSRASSPASHALVFADGGESFEVPSVMMEGPRVEVQDVYEGPLGAPEYPREFLMGPSPWGTQANYLPPECGELIGETCWLASQPGARDREGNRVNVAAYQTRPDHLVGWTVIESAFVNERDSGGGFGESRH